MHACGGEVRSSRQKAAAPVHTTGATGEKCWEVTLKTKNKATM